VQAYAAKSLRVFLLDDHDIVRRGLRDLVSAARDLTVVGESSSARAAGGMIRLLDVDVMVLDLHLQDGTGVDVCREVRAADPSVHGLLLTAASDDEAAIAAILAGAAGYTTKFARSADLIGAIRAAGAGRPIMDPELAQRVTAQLLAEIDHWTPPLDDRDHRLMTLVLDGLTDAQIAERIDADVTTVSADVAALLGRTTGLAAATGLPTASTSRVDDGSSGRHRRSED
jgi:two-component system response regulator DevR